MGWLRLCFLALAFSFRLDWWRILVATRDAPLWSAAYLACVAAAVGAWFLAPLWVTIPGKALLSRALARRLDPLSFLDHCILLAPFSAATRA